jgi:hypothetical protein
LEAAGDYDNAILNIRLYLLIKLPDADARAAQDKIYGLEAKQEKIAKAKVEENSPRAVATRQQNEFEGWLKRLDGARYTYSGIAGDTMRTDSIEIHGRTLVLIYGPLFVVGRFTITAPGYAEGTPCGNRSGNLNFRISDGSVTYVGCGAAVEFSRER